jgi:hypothetical protein
MDSHFLATNRFVGLQITLKVNITLIGIYIGGYTQKKKTCKCNSLHNITPAKLQCTCY